nr:hypothetical protein [Tanacetum cinerariifolium]
MSKIICIVSTKEVVQPAESTNQGQNISSDAGDEASDPSVDKSILQGAKKRVRGPTKKKEIWNLASDEKVLVTFNELCQPIGDEGNELTNCLGTLVRMPQHIGIHYPEWRKVPKEKKDDLWSIVKFRTLVESWFTEEKQVESARKKINRLKSIEPHVTRTKSFVWVKDEETKRNKGVSPSRGGMYCITRTRKDGSIVNVIAAQVVADGLSSIHDNTIDKNPSSASGMSHHQNSHFSVHDTHPNKSDANHQHMSVLPVKESTIQKSDLKKPGGSRYHTSGNKSDVHDSLSKLGTSYT